MKHFEITELERYSIILFMKFANVILCIYYEKSVGTQIKF